MNDASGERAGVRATGAVAVDAGVFSDSVSSLFSFLSVYYSTRPRATRQKVETMYTHASADLRLRDDGFFSSGEAIVEASALGSLFTGDETRGV